MEWSRRWLSLSAHLCKSDTLPSGLCPLALSFLVNSGRDIFPGQGQSSLGNERPTSKFPTLSPFNKGQRHSGFLA